MGPGAVACIACWVLSIYDVFLVYEVLYLVHRRWCSRLHARLNVLSDRTNVLHQVDPYPSRLVVTGYQLGRHIILQRSFIFTHLVSPIIVFHSLHLYLYYRDQTR